jgi:hypothetical protein
MLRRTYAKTQKTLRNLAEVLWTNYEIPQTLHDFCWCHGRLLFFYWTILFVIVDYLKATTCELLQPTPFCVQYSLMNAYQCKHLIAHRSSLANVHAASGTGKPCDTRLARHLVLPRRTRQPIRSLRPPRSLVVAYVGHCLRGRHRTHHSDLRVLCLTIISPDKRKLDKMESLQQLITVFTRIDKILFET